MSWFSSWVGRLVVCLCLVGCAKPMPPVAPPEPPTVTVAQPVRKTVDPYIEVTGFLRPEKMQEIRAQVTGNIVKINFKDGDLVKAGDVLYVIDARPYRAALDKAKADVAVSEAAALKATADLTRSKRLFEGGGGAVSREEYDRAISAKAQADAQILAAKAAVDKAEFDLTNCDIKTDTTGRVDRTLMTEGNLVVASQTKLTTVYSVSPIRAYWDVDEMTSLGYREKIWAGKLRDPRGAEPLKCWITLKNNKPSDKPREGKTAFVAPAIDRGTGTREIYGVFDNADGFLSVGDSVRVKVEAGPAEPQVLVPESAVGSQQRQKFVYVINDKSEAEVRPVLLGQTFDGLVVVLPDATGKPGVSEADRIVVNGLLRVRPGIKVNPQSAPQPSAAK